MAKKLENPKRKDRGVIRLEDLASRRSVKGGSGKHLFGERVDQLEEGESAAETHAKSRPK